MAVELKDVIAVDAVAKEEAKATMGGFLEVVPHVNAHNPLQADIAPFNFANLTKFFSGLVERDFAYNRNQLKYFVTASFIDDLPDPVPVEQITGVLSKENCLYSDLPDFLTLGKSLPGNFTMDMAIVSHACWVPAFC